MLVFNCCEGTLEQLIEQKISKKESFTFEEILDFAE